MKPLPTRPRCAVAGSLPCGSACTIPTLSYPWDGWWSHAGPRHSGTARIPRAFIHPISRLPRCPRRSFQNDHMKGKQLSSQSGHGAELYTRPGNKRQAECKRAGHGEGRGRGRGWGVRAGGGTRRGGESNRTGAPDCGERGRHVRSGQVHASRRQRDLRGPEAGTSGVRGTAGRSLRPEWREKDTSCWEMSSEQGSSWVGPSCPW